MQKTVKLLHITSSLRLGGAEAVLADLVHALSRRGYEQWVVCFHDGPYRDIVGMYGVRVIHVTGFLSLYGPLFWWRLRHIIREFKPDIIHATLWMGNLAGRIMARWLRIPIVCAQHLGDVQHAGIVRRIVDKLSLHMADRVIAVSDAIAEDIKKTTWVHPSRLYVIPNGVDHTAIRMRASKMGYPRIALGLSVHDFVIGTVARLVSGKNIPLLVDATAWLLEQYPSVRLVIIGSGDDEVTVRSRMQYHRIERYVRLVTGNSYAWRYYKMFNCFVQPSRAEGLSIALLEAMSVELPSIVTGYNFQHAVIQHDRDGFIVIPNDMYQLAIAIERLIKERNDSLMLYGAKAHRKVVDHFGAAKMVASYDKILSELSGLPPA